MPDRAFDLPTAQRPKAHRPRTARSPQGEIALIHHDNHGIYGASKAGLALKRECFAAEPPVAELPMSKLRLKSVVRGEIKGASTLGEPGHGSAGLVVATSARASLTGFASRPSPLCRLSPAGAAQPSSGPTFRRTLRRAALTTMTTKLVTEAINQPVLVAPQEARRELAGSTQHIDAGSQSTSPARKRLAETGIQPSVGTPGNHDDALTSRITGSYKRATDRASQALAQCRRRRAADRRIAGPLEPRPAL